MINEEHVTRIRKIPERIRVRAARITDDSPALWECYVRQFGFTNPTEESELGWLVGLAMENGVSYLRDLCKIAKSREVPIA